MCAALCHTAVFHHVSVHAEPRRRGLCPGYRRPAARRYAAPVSDDDPAPAVFTPATVSAILRPGYTVRVRWRDQEGRYREAVRGGARDPEGALPAFEPERAAVLRVFPYVDALTETPGSHGERRYRVTVLRHRTLSAQPPARARGRARKAPEDRAARMRPIGEAPEGWRRLWVRAQPMAGRWRVVYAEAPGEQARGTVVNEPDPEAAVLQALRRGGVLLVEDMAGTSGGARRYWAALPPS